MPYTLAPEFAQQFFDDNGDPLNGGFVYTYLSGTDTPTPTYSDSVSTQNTNPIELSASGRCRMYLDALSYKIVVTDADGNPVGYPMDPVTSTAVGSGSEVASVYVFGENPAALVAQTSYESGATFDKLHPGTAVMYVDSNNLVGTYKLQATGVQDTSGTLTVALVNLEDGAPDTPIATLTITSTTGEVATSSAITWPAGGLQKRYGIKPKVSANGGFVWGIQLIRTA
jgi:hypothetical protein